MASKNLLRNNLVEIASQQTVLRRDDRDGRSMLHLYRALRIGARRLMEGNLTLKGSFF